VDAEVLRPIGIRAAIRRNDPHELERGDVLHGSQRQDWRGSVQEAGKCFGWRHAVTNLNQEPCFGPINPHRPGYPAIFLTTDFTDTTDEKTVKKGH
jgi:hypothetical protein